MGLSILSCGCSVQQMRSDSSRVVAWNPVIEPAQFASAFARSASKPVCGSQPPITTCPSCVPDSLTASLHATAAPVSPLPRIAALSNLPASSANLMISLCCTCADPQLKMVRLDRDRHGAATPFFVSWCRVSTRAADVNTCKDLMGQGDHGVHVERANCQGRPRASYIGATSMHGLLHCAGATRSKRIFKFSKYARSRPDRHSCTADRTAKLCRPRNIGAQNTAH
jgi:hypothetical protein